MMSQNYRSSPIRKLIVVLTACLVLTATAQAQRSIDPNQKSSPKVLAAFRPIVDGPSRSTLRVLCDGKDAALGTIVAADGWVVTKASELRGKVTCKLKDGRELEARIVGVHDKHDLAMLKIEAKGLRPVEWRESRADPVGSWVAAPGLGEDPVAVGVISVSTRTLSPRDAGPARPVTSTGYLGVQLEQGDGGAKINHVDSGSAAAKAGLKINDTVVSVEGKPISDTETMIGTIQDYKPGDTICLRVKRGDQEMELKATLDKRPVNSRGDVQNRMGSELSNRRTGFPTILQHDTVLKPSDCGGPIVDLDGKVLGVNIARAGRTESYAVPSEVILKLLDDLKSGKLAPSKLETAALSRARSALEKAEEEKDAAERKFAEARSALRRAERSKNTAKVDEAKAAVLEAGAEKEKLEKKVAEVRAAMEKAEAEAKKEAKVEGK